MTYDHHRTTLYSNTNAAHAIPYCTVIEWPGGAFPSAKMGAPAI